MSNQPNEVDKAKQDPFLHKIVRSSFRIPIEDSQDIWVKIDNKKYPVKDICLEGIGIVFEDPKDFQVSATKMDCELQLYDTHVTGLHGRIIHFSLNSGQDWQCGIQWIKLEKESAKQIFDAVRKLKIELLKGNNDSGITITEGN